MNYTHKDIIATIFLKKGMLVKGFKDHTPVCDPVRQIKSFNDNGMDKIILYDLSDDPAEHDQNLQVLKKIIQIAEIPVYAGGNINSFDDVRKLIYAGCRKVILNSLKEKTPEIAKEGASRFGQNRFALSIFNVDMFFKQKDSVQQMISELVVLDPKLAGTIGNVTDMPYSILMPDLTPEQIRDTLASEDTIRGISCLYFNEPGADITGLKKYLGQQGIRTDHLEAELKWEDLKLNSDGLIPVVVQDYKTNDVLMLAYMNEEAFSTTLAIGKMTYYSRSRRELWIKGLTSGHYQYVKSLRADCDYDTILAKVSQVGAACHTGSRSCFFNKISDAEYTERNLFDEFEREYKVIRDRKINPKEGSYTNYLFDEGIDKMLKKIGGETNSIILAAKNNDRDDLKYQISDFIYHLMVLMVEKNISIEDVLEELSLR